LVPDLDGLLAAGVDWAIVATPHDTAALFVPTLLAAGLKVLVEKPLGRSEAEARRILESVSDPDQVRVGLNYRFFPGIARLLADVRDGVFGPLVSMTIVMGHGGAPGDESSWKLDPTRAGGGALIDPGIHLLDLCRLVADGDLEVLAGSTWTGFWNTGIEEECHLLLRGGRLPLANIQISVVRWRSTFRLEVQGTDGYGVVEGRDRSYGPQAYRRGHRWGWRTSESQAASEEILPLNNDENVFVTELDAILFPVDTDFPKPCDGPEALALMCLLDCCRRAVGIEPHVDAHREVH
jgi:predicted dehydrogenase